MKTYRLFIW